MRYCGIEIPMPPELQKEYDRIRVAVRRALKEYDENLKNPPMPPMD